MIFRSPASGSADSRGMTWLITGTLGELEITTPEMQWQLGPPGTSIKIRTKDSAGVEEVGYEDEGEAGHVRGVKFPGTNTARVYEAFATGRKGNYAGFGDAVGLHAMLDRIRAGADA